MEPFMTIIFNITLNMPTTPEPVISGIPPGVSRIVNGYKVDTSEVPYHATLNRVKGNNSMYFCGAAIIHERAVLTAAHCVDQLVNNIMLGNLLTTIITQLLSLNHSNKTIDISKYLIVYAGTTFINKGGNVYKVSKVIKHEDYSMKTIQADIAFIVLVKNIEFNKKVNLIPFAPKDYEVADGTEAIVTGFGSTSFQSNILNSQYSERLQAAKVYITNQKTCASAYNTFHPSFLTLRVICAAATAPPRDACAGDSGGPLVANGYLIGIVSFGRECANPSYPGVYTKVSYYYDWIQNNLRKRT